MQEQTYVTVGEVAALAGCSEEAVCKAIREGRLRGERFGKRVLRIPLSAARKYAERAADTGRPRQGFKSR